MAVCLAQRAGLVTVCPASLAMMETMQHDTTDTPDTDKCRLTGELLRSVDVIELPILLPLFIATLLIILLQRQVWHVLSFPFPPVIRRHLLFCTFRE